jgi:hypothetical protein
MLFSANLKLSSTEKTFHYKLGERKLPIKVKQYGDVKDLVFINMHDDENSSVEATKLLLEKAGGLLIEVDNFQKRNIKFKIGNSIYQFDPNRIFTREGIEQTLMFHHKRVNKRAADEIEKFGQWLVRLIPEKPKCVIALHNNSEGNFTIKNYLPEGDRKGDALNVHFATEQDPDDFVITTDEEIFISMKEEGYNVMLQDNINAREDGSLSVYCGKRNMSYVNLETQHGKMMQYKIMMEKLLNTINRKDEITEYNYLVDLKEAHASSMIISKTKIYFNEKIVGEIKSTISGNDSTALKGQLIIKNGFRIYSNSDFFLIPQPAGDTIIEIRIDPTREKKIFDEKSETVQIIQTAFSAR